VHHAVYHLRLDVHAGWSADLNLVLSRRQNAHVDTDAPLKVDDLLAPDGVAIDVRHGVMQYVENLHTVAASAPVRTAISSRRVS
jgi:hypothetical protein